MDLYKAIEIVLSFNSGKRPIEVKEFVKAINIVLDAMRSEITKEELIKWCLEHKSSGENNVGQNL